MNITSHLSAFNADCYTPVQLYMNLRHRFRKTCLLESNDYHSRQDSISIIGLDPLVEIDVQNGTVQLNSLHSRRTFPLSENREHRAQIQDLLDEFILEPNRRNGFFGRVGFEFTQMDETRLRDVAADQLPQLHLLLFRYVIVIDHFTNEGELIENALGEAPSCCKLEDLLNPTHELQLPFETSGIEKCQLTDNEFKTKVEEAIEYCKQGDVFQLVLSNSFRQAYFGDDFHVYRTLRRLNPSPYLFYFDFESYRLFGSSPEAQLRIKNGHAEIHPIAGTVPRTGIPATDAFNLQHLLSDAKENAEHTMLVDLARNDLSRSCEEVKVKSFKEIQHFSHVTHLVSRVQGRLLSDRHFETFCQSFPAGTLSGTPKPRALELIDQMEGRRRNYYGGAVGLFGSGAQLNTAIVIRSILSMNQQLHYTAGAGVVVDSDPQRETDEIHHKLKAVRRAIALSVQQCSLIPQTATA